MKAERRRAERPGQKQLAVWLPVALMERLGAHVAGASGRTQRGEVAAALEQYLAMAALSAQAPQ